MINGLQNSKHTERVIETIANLKPGKLYDFKLTHHQEHGPAARFMFLKRKLIGNSTVNYEFLNVAKRRKEILSRIAMGFLFEVKE